MKKVGKSGITLIELIIVITLLVTLMSIVFISLQGYGVYSRDTKRISDVKTIETGLELNYSQGGGFPYPDNKINVTFSGSEFLSQGYAGKMVSQVARIANGIPKDPTTDTEYFYSRSLNSYSIGTFLEGEEKTALLNNIETYADFNKNFYSKGKDAGIIFNFSGSLLNSDLEINSIGSEKFYLGFSAGFSEVGKEQLETQAIMNDKSLAKNDLSLVGYWDFETFTSSGLLADLSSYGNHGTIKNNVEFVDSYYGKAGLFNGKNWIVSNNFNDSSITDKISFSVILEPTTSIQNDLASIFRLSDGQNGFSFRFYWQNILQFFIFGTTGNFYSPPNDLKTSIGKNQINIYNGTYNGNKAFLYKNGNLIISVDGNIGNILKVFHDFYIGGGQFSSGFNGKIDELKIYNRVLSADEIKYMYNKYLGSQYKKK